MIQPPARTRSRCACFGVGGRPASAWVGTYAARTAPIGAANSGSGSGALP